jgi:uncharacterized membrane protein
MESLLILIALIFSVYALVTTSKTTSQLIARITNLEHEIEKLHLILRKLRKEKPPETQETIVPHLHKTPTQPETSSSTEQPFDSEEGSLITEEFKGEVEFEFDTEPTIEENHPPTTDTTTPLSDNLLPSSLSHSKPPKKRTSQELEALIGGKLLNRIGAIAMILAVGFFLKFAFDNNWINEWARVSMGAAFGVGMIALAGYFHKKELSIFAQGIVAIGVSSLYLSVFAAYNFYQLLPQIPAFVLMMGITIIAFLQALKFNSLAAALLALAGGFLTPFLLPSAQPNEVGLFTYIAFLDVGILVLVIAKERWNVLEYLARFATYLVYFEWYSHFYKPESEFVVTLFHLTLFWSIFFGFEVYRIAVGSREMRGLAVIGSVMNVLAYYFGLVAILNNSYHSDSKGVITLLLGCVYFGTFLVLNSRGKVDDTLRKQYIFTAIILLTLAISTQYRNYMVVALWSLEAFVLFWCGVRWKLGFVRIFTVVLLGLSIMMLTTCPDIYGYWGVSKFQLIFNNRAFGMWSYILTVASMSLLSKRIEDIKNGQLYNRLLTYLWISALFAWLTLETNDYFQSFINYNLLGDLRVWPEYIQELSFGFVWGSYGLLLLVGGWLRKNRDVVDASMIVSIITFFGAALVSSSFNPIIDHVLLFNIRVGLLVYLMVAFAVQLGILRRSHEFSDRIPLRKLYQGFFGIAILLLIFELVSAETYSYYEKEISLLSIQHGGGSTPYYLVSDIENKRQLMLSVVWLVYSIILMVVGFGRKIRSLRLASIALSGFVILKVFLFDLSFLTMLYRIISFFGLGVILLLTSYFYQRYKHRILGEEPIETK